MRIKHRRMTGKIQLSKVIGQSSKRVYYNGGLWILETMQCQCNLIIINIALLWVDISTQSLGMWEEQSLPFALRFFYKARTSQRSVSFYSLTSEVQIYHVSCQVFLLYMLILGFRMLTGFQVTSVHYDCKDLQPEDFKLDFIVNCLIGQTQIMFSGVYNYKILASRFSRESYKII